jgi:hypothetical protein
LDIELAVIMTEAQSRQFVFALAIAALALFVLGLA